MTFTEAIAALVITVDRDDLTPTFGAWLNKGVHETALRWNFKQMKKTGSVTIPTGSNTIALPADFKAWQTLRFPVSIAIGVAPAVPVPVYTSDEIERLSPTFRPSLYLLFTQDDDAYQITLPANAAADHVCTLRYFAYPAEVTNMDTTTPLLRDYEDLVMSKTRQLIFQSINDPVYTAHEAQFNKALMDLTGVNIKSAFVKSVKPQPDAEGEQPS